MEETNRIRAALGIKPLRTKPERTAKPENKLLAAAPSTLRATVTSRNGEITCSVEETNRVRAALGLRPLRTETSAAKEEPVEDKQSSRKAQALKERLERARRARKTRARAVGARSIAEEALLEEDSDDVDEASGLMAWVARSRQQEASSESKGKSKAPLRERKAARAVNKASTINHSATQPIQGSPVQGEILTLADAPILPENKKDGDSDPAEDALVNPLKVVKKRPRSPEICGATYDGTDTKEFGAGTKIDPGTISIEPTAPPIVESDYKGGRKADNDIALRKHRKREKSKRGKKRRRISEVEQEDHGEPQRMSDDPQVKKGRMEEIRKAANSAANMYDDSDDDDPFYTNLAKATRRAKNKEIKSSVDTILEAIDRANAAVAIEGNEAAAAAQDAERSVYNEMEQFLQKIPTAPGPSDGKVNGKGDGEYSIPQEGKKENEGGLQKTARETGEPPGKVVKQAANENSASDSVREAEEAQDAESSLQPTAEPVGLAASPSADNGLAATLRRLRAMGELKHKPNQMGRARDKRFNESTGTETRENDRREIKLSYTDEYGNELTRKEAFRMLCHKFHGKGPGQNKREKRLRKMLESTKTLQMQADDTPLASAAALKEETRKLGKAHVVLSGPEALARGLALSKLPAKTKESSLSKVRQTREAKKEPEPEEEKVSISFGIGGRGTSRKRR